MAGVHADKGLTLVWGMASVSFVLFLLVGPTSVFVCAKAQEKVGSKGLSNERAGGEFPHCKARETEEGKGHSNHRAETIALRSGGLGLSHVMAAPLLCDLGCDVSPLRLTSPAFG